MRIALMITSILVAVVVMRGLRIAQDAEQNPLDRELTLISQEAGEVAERIGTSMQQLQHAQQSLESVREHSARRLAALEIRHRDIQRSQESTQRRLESYQVLLQQNEGALLADGTYVAPHLVVSQYEHERERHETLLREQKLLDERLESERRLQSSYDSRCRQVRQTLDQLRTIDEHLRDQLDRVAILKNAAGQTSLSSELGSDVRSVQRAVAHLEHQLDAFAQMTSE